MLHLITNECIGIGLFLGGGEGVVSTYNSMYVLHD
jgi:hypothetical protein